MWTRLAACFWWLRSVWRRRRLAEEARAELEAHVDLLVERGIRAGMTPDQAQKAARERLGNIALTREDLYQMNSIRWVDDLVQDLRYAVRLFSRQPAFSAVAIATVALAMGLATSLFSVIDAAVLRPLAYPNPEQIVSATVGTRRQGFGDRLFNSAASLADMDRWKDTGVFTALAAWDRPFAERIIDGPVPERVAARDVTPGYLALLGVTPALGRDITPADTAEGAPPVVMLGHAYWRDRLGSAAGAIGTTIRYDDVSAVVIGVLPAGFQPDVTVWRPMRVDSESANVRGRAGTVYGRLRAGIGLEEAERLLSAVTPAADARSPETETGSGQVRLTSVLDQTVGQSRTTVTMLGGAVGLIVLIACVNVAGLLLARGATRQNELAVRVSMGAGRTRLIRQLLVEGIALSLVGCLTGTVVAWWLLSGLVSILPLTLQPGVFPVIDLRVLAAGTALAVATGVLFGLWPAFRLSRTEVSAALAQGRRSHGSELSRRGGQYLIAAEVALAVVLVVGGGLMLRSFARLTSVDLGFDPERVIAFGVVPVEPKTAESAGYYQDLLRVLRALPGVESAGAVDAFALSQTSFTTMVTANGTATGSAVRHVLPGYFEAMGFQVTQGRFPSPLDEGLLAVINESAARTMFPEGAVGREVTVSKRSFEVVGVIADIRHGGPSATTQPEVFVSLASAAGVPWLTATGMTVVVRPHERTAALQDMLQRTTASLGPRVVIEPVRPGAAWFNDLVAAPRHRTTLIGLLAICGLSLALVGVFTTTAYAVTRRTREIGVRMALGAQPSSVIRLLVRDAAWPLALGLAAGLGVAFYASRLVQSFLFEITPHDPLTFGGVALVLAIAVMAAAWLPARRAARVDPVATLRGDG